MPNWCSTSIKIIHNDEEKLKELKDKIEEWTSKEYTLSDFGNNWLGNIVLGSGIGTVDTNKKTDIRCRGTLQYIDLISNELSICTETAWSPLLQIWKKLLKKYLPDAEIIYAADEPGMELYLTNDPDLFNKYYIDSWELDDFESRDDYSKEELIEILQKLLKSKESGINILLNLFEDSDFADKMNVHKWEYADISDLE